MGLKKQIEILIVKGHYKKQTLQKTKTVSAIQSANQANPQSAGTMLVSVTPKLTNTQKQSTDTTTQNTKTMATQQKLFQESSPTSISLLADSLARAFRSLASGKGCQERILEALYSLKFGELPGIKDLEHYCLKMCRDCSHRREARIFKPYSDHWMKSGMMSNGIALTLKTSVSHRTENECSLSDILEDKVSKKYFLSKKAIKRITQWNSQENPLANAYEQGGRKDIVE